MAFETFEITLSRHAFGPRETARAGDIWRALQDIAVEGSSRRGWPPARYAAAGSGFVVRRMRVLHARTLRYGEPLTAQTWVADFRRGLLTTRRLTLAGATSAVDACQEWAHVDTALLRISKAPDALIGAFPPELRTDEPAMPMLTRPVEAEATRMSFDVWFTWMDPLGHVNHPAYIDYCDEALARLVVSLGGDPHLIEPVAEELLFKRGLVAPEAATVTLRPVGLTSDGAWVLLAEVSFADGAVAATGTLVRRVPVALA